MATYELCKNVVSGLFRVRNVLPSDVVEYVKSWTVGPDAERFDRLSVRKCRGLSQRDKVMVAIELQYWLDDGTPSEIHAQFIAFRDKYCGLLIQRYGVNYANYDLNHPTYEFILD